MRAIALNGELKAKLRELDREALEYGRPKFTLSDAADELWKMGYELVRSGLPIQAPECAQHIEVELQTICGCTKRVFMPVEELRRGRRVPCMPKMSAKLFEPNERGTISVREFEFVGFETRENGKRSGPPWENVRQVAIMREVLR